MLSLFSGQKRQREAFEREAMPHLTALHAYALHLCRDASDADDLVQETYIKALSNFASYQPGTNCRAWLFRILTNTYFNLRRSRKRHNPIDSEMPELAMEMAESAQDRGMYRPMDVQLLDGVVSKHVTEALDALPPEFRTVLLLADLHDFSYKEIADVVECPVGTVMSRLFRARKAMQKRLTEHAIQEGILARPPVEEGVADLVEFRSRSRKSAI